jgi:peptidoglycan/LPS O-acetylase OafA/YrhL
LKYRAEIDGLRAFAVVPVILFHAGFEMFSGGFVGVDVFFVISGYLITTILIDDIENNRFSIIKFYERRARRILPALFFVILACIPFAWMWMLPSQMKDFSRSLIAVSLFASNILFWKESGYFAAASEEKPLLHTWSLAVEEQYYLLFPIFLFFAWRYGKDRVFWMIVICAFISLLLSEWGWRSNPNANFYLPPTRLWELLAGSITAFVVQKHGLQSNNALALLGLAAVVFAIFAYDETTPFPSVYALVPVIGVVLLVLFGEKDTLAAKILSTKLFVGIGLISYSAYLWHQPLFAFARIRSAGDVSAKLMIGLSILSLVLAVGSWRYIEKPFRSAVNPFISRKLIFIGSLVGFLSFVGFGGLGYFLNGFGEQRYDKQYLAIRDISFLRSQRHERLGASGVRPEWLLLGDSHADALQDQFSALLSKYNASALVGTVAGCPPSINLWRHDLDYKLKCHKHYLEILDNVKDLQINNVLISARYALYMNSTRYDNGEGGVEISATDKVIYDHLDYKDVIRSDDLRHSAIERELVAFVGALTRLSVNIFIIRSIPEIGWNVPQQMERDNGLVSTSRSSYNSRVASLSGFYSKVSGLPNVTLLHSEEVLCDDVRCNAVSAGFPLYYDTNHLSVYGARFLLDSFERDLFENRTEQSAEARRGKLTTRGKGVTLK